MGMVMFSPSHVVSATVSSSGGGLLPLLQCGVSSIGDSFTTSPMWVLPTVHYKLLRAGPFHGVQFFRNALLQHSFPMGSQVLTANLLQHGLPFSSGTQVLPVYRASLGSSKGFSQDHKPSFGPPLALMWASPQAAGGPLLHWTPPWAAEAQPDSPWSTPWIVREYLLQHLEHLLPLLLHWLWCLQSYFSHTFSLFPSLAAIFFCTTTLFFSFLNVLTQKHYYHHSWIQPQPMADPSWSQLE